MPTSPKAKAQEQGQDQEKAKEDPRYYPAPILYVNNEPHPKKEKVEDVMYEDMVSPCMHVPSMMSLDKYIAKNHEKQNPGGRRLVRKVGQPGHEM